MHSSDEALRKVRQDRLLLEAVLRGRQPDWWVEVNDIIFVPGSSFKTVGHGLPGMLPNIATTGAQQGAVR